MVALLQRSEGNYFVRVDSCYDALFSGNKVANALVNLFEFYASCELEQRFDSKSKLKETIENSEWFYCGYKTYNGLVERILGLCNSRQVVIDTCKWLISLGYLKIERPNKRKLKFFVNTKAINKDLSDGKKYQYKDFTSKVAFDKAIQSDQVGLNQGQQLASIKAKVGLNQGQLEEDTLYINRSIEILLDQGSEEILNSGEGEVMAVATQPISLVKEAKIEAEDQDAFRKENNETVPSARSIKVNNPSHKDKENDPLFVSIGEQWGKTPKEVYEGFKGFIKQSVGNKANNPEAYAEGTIKKAIADPDNNQLWQEYLKANKPPDTEPRFITLLAAVTEFKCHYSSDSSYAIQRVLEIFSPFGWTFEDFLFHARKKGYLVGFPV